MLALFVLVIIVITPAFVASPRSEVRSIRYQASAVASLQFMD